MLLDGGFMFSGPQLFAQLSFPEREGSGSCPCPRGGKGHLQFLANGGQALAGATGQAVFGHRSGKVAVGDEDTGKHIRKC